MADALFLRAMRAAIERAPGFDAVTDDAAAAVAAFRRECVDGALEAIEVVRNAVDDDLNRFVVFVAATFAGGAAM